MLFRMSSTLPILALPLMLMGCAVVEKGVDREVKFTSEPVGATVKTSIGSECITPCVLTIGSKQEFSATFELAGHAPKTIDVKTKVGSYGAAIYAGSAILSGVGGVAGTQLNGSALEHDPNPVHAQLEKLASPSQRPATPRGARRL